MAQRVNKIFAACSLVFVSLTLAACSDDGSLNAFSSFNSNGNSYAQNSYSNALEGRWVDANGIPSTFHNGVFETRSPDTHEKLSEGNYTFTSDDVISIEMRSLVRGTVSQVNCSLGNTKLYCTSENNQRFILMKG